VVTGLGESAATLVHAFVTSRIDYCNVLLAGAPKATTEKLQRLLNAAARLVSDTRISSIVLCHSLSTFIGSVARRAETSEVAYSVDGA